MCFSVPIKCDPKKSLHSHPHCSFAATEMMSVGVSYVSLLNAVTYHCAHGFKFGQDNTIGS
uniref:Uncharacterized protein n=1 Tax=Oryza glumipatula TaxID=40148 RepID=A0A0E0ASE7_9ORYZ